jgi:arylsulfatase A-like enzyme
MLVIMRLALLSLFLPLAASGAATPNVVFFLVDDLGQRDLGCYGSSFYETPHLDKLATQGAKFTQAYAACPVCSPTRAAIQTGRWPQRSGITDYIGAPLKPEAWKRNTRLLPAPYSDRLAHEEQTLAELLKPQGYATFFGGKWHLGPEGWWPEDQGYDVNKGGVDKGGPYGPGKYFTPYANPRLPDGPPGEHLPDRIASEACQFMEQQKEKPFFIFFSFYDVHTPLQARPDLLAKYEAKRSRLGLQPSFAPEGPRENRTVQEHAIYAAMVEAMDAAVGKVLAKLDALGKAEDTLVIFTSDNGGLSTSEGSPTSNLPLRAGKGWLYEGGIREPLLIRWPGQVSAGRVIDTPVYSPDYFPTLAAITGAKLSQQPDGANLLPLLKGDALPDRDLLWAYPHYGNQGGAPGAAIRRGNWKLISWSEHPDTPELYDLAKDPSEQKNLASENATLMVELSTKLSSWQTELGAKQARPNPAYDPTKPDGRSTGKAGGKAKK